MLLEALRSDEGRAEIRREGDLSRGLSLVGRCLAEDGGEQVSEVCGQDIGGVVTHQGRTSLSSSSSFTKQRPQLTHLPHLGGGSRRVEAQGFEEGVGGIATVPTAAVAHARATSSRVYMVAAFFFFFLLLLVFFLLKFLQVLQRARCAQPHCDARKQQIARGGDLCAAAAAPPPLPPSAQQTSNIQPQTFTP